MPRPLSSVDVLALHVEDEHGLGRDVGRGPLVAVRHVGRDGQTPLAAHLKLVGVDV